MTPLLKLEAKVREEQRGCHPVGCQACPFVILSLGWSLLLSVALPRELKKTGYGHGGAFSLPIQGRLCLAAALLLPPTGYQVLSSATVTGLSITTEQKAAS